MHLMGTVRQQGDDMSVAALGSTSIHQSVSWTYFPGRQERVLSQEGHLAPAACRSDSGYFVW